MSFILFPTSAQSNDMHRRLLRVIEVVPSGINLMPGPTMLMGLLLDVISRVNAYDGSASHLNAMKR